MNTVTSPALIPVIYSAHHASHNFGQNVNRVQLTTDQQIRFSDYGSDQTVPQNGLLSLVGSVSRALGDLNRAPTDGQLFPLLDFAKPTPNAIWRPGESLTDSEKAQCLRDYYTPYHQRIIEQLRKQTSPTLVVAWDNTADYIIGQDTTGQDVRMPTIVLSNCGFEGSPSSRADGVTSCRPELLLALQSHLQTALTAHSMPADVRLNTVFSGGYICQTYSSLRNSQALQDFGITAHIESLQIEYNTALTHDQASLQPNQEAIATLRAICAKVIEQACISTNFVG